ncbi:MAG: hypothetical protein E6K79_05515 [Candidatus Eisenbacteria bacterium]|uniref:Uncharacterized protein n=1 Tax=Eiseniibacteriota bacterium TaxID=2212470 RepID=A0A538TNN2_UNCEI|nr:MAG: hypothetical protein E6K79_05515 [Candidatus Eisenbacteria bacterium]
MRFPDPAPRMFLLLPLCLVLIAAGCSDSRDPLGPSQTKGAAALSDALQPGSDASTEAGRLKPTLSNIWPNDDGRSWTFRIQERSWRNQFTVRAYPTPAQVPPVPSLDDVAVLLRWLPIGPNAVVSTAGYRMQFNGTRTTASGAVGQNLETTVLEAPSPAEPPTNSVAGVPMPTGFLRALSVARPDLAPKIARRWPAAAARAFSAATATSVRAPDFLFGYAWVKTSEFIGSYGDVSTQLAWKYLVADLTRGSTFSLQLVPDLASDIFLHARVLREPKPINGANRLRSALQVLYVIDFGVSLATDVNGNVTGYYRVYSYGTVDYIAGVGPVASYERAYVAPGMPLDPGQYDQTISLAATVARPQLP